MRQGEENARAATTTGSRTASGGGVLVACGAFKGSLGAPAACSAIAHGLRAAHPGITVRTMPVADGGDGTLDALEAAGFTPTPAASVGPTGEPVASRFVARGPMAVVELADACGLARLPGGRLAGMTASSEGAGRVLAAALDAGYRNLVLGLGGSASTDGGLGLLLGLRARAWTADGGLPPSGVIGLEQVTGIDLTGLHPGLRAARLTIATDVTSPLLGPRGAAAVFGPQKGLDPGQVRRAEAALARWAGILAAACAQQPRDGAAPATHARPAGHAPGAGAAGGTGFAALSALGATRRSGFEVIADLIGLDAAIVGARLVITGEGSLDAQSLAGKAPAGVARRAAAAGARVVAVCGRSSLSPSQLRAAGVDTCLQLAAIEPDQARSIREAPALLATLARQIAL